MSKNQFDDWTTLVGVGACFGMVFVSLGIVSPGFMLLIFIATTMLVFLANR